MARTEKSNEAELLAADAVGDVIEMWGFRKGLGRMWTILYVSSEALSAAQLAERLQMSAGAVSMALGELQEWGVAKRVWRPGERKEFYEAETDFWKMISKVVSERERHLVASVRERLERASSLLKFGARAPEVKFSLDRVKRLLAFAATAELVIDAFVTSRQADFSKFGDLASGVLQLARARRSD